MENYFQNIFAIILVSFKEKNNGFVARSIFIILKTWLLLGSLAAALKKQVVLSHHIKPWETVMVDFF